MKKPEDNLTARLTNIEPYQRSRITDRRRRRALAVNPASGELGTLKPERLAAVPVHPIVSSRPHFFLLLSLKSSIAPRTSEPTELAFVRSELSTGENTPLV